MDDISSTTVNQLQAAIDFVKKRKEEIVVYLVVKLKDSDNFLDQYDYSSEFFSEEELSDYINALESLGIFRVVTYGEDDFIRKLHQGYFDKFHQKYKIVFNTTGSRRIRSRSALIPALCELLHLRYASSDILTCSILENKTQAFQLLAYHGFPLPKTWFYHPRYGWEGPRPSIGEKIIIKPGAESASIGITQQSVGFYSADFECKVIEESQLLNEPIIVQEFIEGWEVEAPILSLNGPNALPPMGIELNGKPFLDDSFLSYETVFSDNYRYYRFDKIDADLSRSLMDVAESSYRALDLCGTVRVDYRVKADKHFYITDYNNSPHLTRFHSVAKSFQSLGFDYADLFCLLLYRCLVNKF